MDEKINHKLDEQKRRLELMHAQIREMNSKVTTIEKDVAEILRELGVIYNSVDELEPKLLSERLTK